jgi:CDP-paratose 2-epimerase
MKKAIVTGCNGLVGAEAVALLCENDYVVYGFDNDMRRYFFGAEASTFSRGLELTERFKTFLDYGVDVRKIEEVMSVFERIDGPVDLIVHTAAQPSHDWAAKEPRTDFDVNAIGTLNMLEVMRAHFPEATFAHISTSKVYGDNPNRLAFSDRGKRIDVGVEHPFYEGIDTSMSVEGCLHSLFGVSKLAGDLLVQEYGRYFGMNTVCFRPGCVTGPGHAGAELHGFLSYLVKCVVKGLPYTIFGYEGKQVRCNIYGRDLAAACLEFHSNPKPGAVYNIGGGRENAISMIEAIELAEKITGKTLTTHYEPKARIGDHMWWISSNRDFERDFPRWEQSRTVDQMIEEIAAT